MKQAVRDYFPLYEREDRVPNRLLEKRAKTSPDDPFVVWNGRGLSVGHVNERANRLARGMRRLGIGRGTQVAVLCENGPEYLYTWFALLKLGAVEVPVNTAYKGEILGYVLENCGAQFAVVDAGLLGRINEVAHETPALKRVIVVGGGSPEAGALDTVAFGDLLDADGMDLGEEVGHGELACIMYTSGTTGLSKGVMISRHHQASFGFFYANIVRYTADDVALNYLPLFHIAGRFVTVACLLSGAKMVLSPRFSVGSFWDEVRRHGVTTFVAVGGICHMLYSMPEREDDAENTIRAVYAVPAPAAIYTAFERRFGCKLVEAYGATETNLVVYTDLDESPKGSCGRPNSEYFEVRIADEYDDEVPAGTPGEILVRAKRPYLMMSGYHGLPEKTVEANRNLWFHTGDQACMDKDGYVHFIDRVKDAIRRRGENISSFEVERLVTGHPAVAETAAIGVPSPLGEEDVKVVVVLKPGVSLGHEELLRYCAEHMPYFMVPRYIEFVDALPRTPTAKVKKYELRQEGASGVTEGTWDREEHGLRVMRDGTVVETERTTR